MRWTTSRRGMLRSMRSRKRRNSWMLCSLRSCPEARILASVSKRTHWMLALANDMVKVCLRSCKSSVKQRSSQQQPHSIREITGNDQFRSDDYLDHSKFNQQIFTELTTILYA